MFFDGDDPRYSIHEVYYDEHGKPNAYAEGEAVLIWYGAPHLGKGILAMVQEAFNKPVLTPADFGVKPEQNQCDGCMAGFAINERGNHVNADGIAFMSCQRGKYE
jgi:hypothetical protein